VEEALRAFLRGTTALSDLVSRRIEWDALPQKAGMPAITLTEVAGARQYTMKGRDRLVGYLIQIDCWGLSRKACRDAALAVVAACDAPPSDPLVRLFVEAQRSAKDPGVGGEPDFYRTSLDTRVWATEA
jgi:hypothetical protein